MSVSNDNRFSYSGLKTSLKYKIDKFNSTNQKYDLTSICASYQDAIFDQVIKKLPTF